MIKTLIEISYMTIFRVLFSALLISAAIIVLLLALFNTSILPPIGIFYALNGVTWLVPMRVIGASLIAVASMVLSFTTIHAAKNGLIRKDLAIVSMLKYVSLSMWAISLIGLVTVGGGWHLASAIFGLVAGFMYLVVMWIHLRSEYGH